MKQTYNPIPKAKEAFGLEPHTYWRKHGVCNEIAYNAESVRFIHRSLR